MPLPRFLQRKSPTSADTSAAQADEDSPAVQEARTQARRRLMGAVVLLGVGVVVFPLLFETQPRPGATEVTIEAGRKVTAASVVTGKSGSLPLSPSAATPHRDASGPVVNATTGAGVIHTAPEAPMATMDAAPPEPAQTSPASLPASVPMASQPSESTLNSDTPGRLNAVAKASAAEGVPSSGRYVVQVGAFTDMVAVREARQKVEKLGLKTYIQSIESATGKRTRVRVGPFETREEAESAAVRLKAASFPAFIFAL